MKNILNKIPELRSTENKLSGGFTAMPAAQMAKIKGGGGTNQNCTNNSQCNAGTNQNCVNFLGCGGTTNIQPCTNSHPCDGINKPRPVLQ